MLNKIVGINFENKNVKMLYFMISQIFPDIIFNVLLTENISQYLR